MKNLEKEFDFYECGNIAFLNGQEGMHETESALFKRLASFNFQNIYCIDDLFNHPERLKVLPLLNIETIVLGTTGTYRDKLDMVFDAFEKLNWKPKNALITMGDGAFEPYAKDVNLYKLMPMMWSDDSPLVMGF